MYYITHKHPATNSMTSVTKDAQTQHHRTAQEKEEAQSIAFCCDFCSTIINYISL